MSLRGRAGAYIGLVERIEQEQEGKEGKQQAVKLEKRPAV